MAREHVYDASNEQVVIRAAIADAEKRRVLVHQLGDSEFLVPAHSAIWRGLRALVDRGLDYSAETLRQLIAAEGAAPDEDYVTDLEASAAVPANLEWHVETLRWDATRARTLKGAVPELVKELEDPKVTAERAVGVARAVVRALEGGGGRRHVHRPAELARSYKSDLRARRENGAFYSYGWPAMDNRLTYGAAPGKTAVVAGLSGAAKSTWTSNLAIQLAKLRRKVMVCAWEMGGVDTIDIMVSSMTGIDLKNLVQGKLSDEEIARVERASEWITGRIRFMENAFFERVASGGKPSNDRNLDILEGYIAEAGCDVWIYDLWERLIVDLRPEAVTNALKRQQHMHKEYSVHGILVQQLNLKDVEKRADKRPTREAIKGTGAYVEVADLIFGVHRDAQFKAVPDDTIEVICLKQRKGEANWAMRCEWDGRIGRVGAGVEVPYDPGLENVGEHGEITDPSKIRTRPRSAGRKIGRRDM